MYHRTTKSQSPRACPTLFWEILDVKNIQDGMTSPGTTPTSRARPWRGWQRRASSWTSTTSSLSVQPAGSPSSPGYIHTGSHQCHLRLPVQTIRKESKCTKWITGTFLVAKATLEISGHGHWVSQSVSETVTLFHIIHDVIMTSLQPTKTNPPQL